MRSGHVEEVLAAIVSPDRPALEVGTMLVFAHPDDETLACGALLPRLRDVRLVHVTDGAPRGGDDARRLGFASAHDYAAARRRELAAALSLAGIAEDRLSPLGIPDQEAAFRLTELTRTLVGEFARADLVITHALEGGHPDHDATCFAVHTACEILRSQGAAPAIVEAPLYRAGPNGEWLRQSFPGEAPVLRLSPAERELKRAMVAAHLSQRETLASFGAADEPYRASPKPDFDRLPNGGDLLYERYGWGLTGTRWLELVAEARHELRLGARD